MGPATGTARGTHQGERNEPGGVFPQGSREVRPGGCRPAVPAIGTGGGLPVGTGIAELRQLRGNARALVAVP